MPLSSLRTLAGRPSSRAADDDPRVAVLHHSEFGWDVRLEGSGGPHPGGWNPPPGRGRRGFFLLLALALLGGALALVATQPGATQAPGQIIGHLHDAVQGLLSRHNNSPATAGRANPPAANPPKTPAAPRSPAADTPATNGSPPADATAANSGATPTAAPGPTPVPPVHLSGQYTHDAGGAPSTICSSGRTAPGSCAWSVSVAAGNPLYLSLQWSGDATVAMRVTGTDGHTLFSSSNASGLITANLPTPAASMLVTVTVAAGNAAFDLALANHA